MVTYQLNKPIIIIVRQYTTVKLACMIIYGVLRNKLTPHRILGITSSAYQRAPPPTEKRDVSLKNSGEPV